MRLALLLLLTIVTVPAFAASPQRIVLFRDGALVEKERQVRAGYLEERLPPGYLGNSLRVMAAPAAIRRVEVTPVKPDPRQARQTAALAERVAQLRDRLRALETEEDIYKGAAKSQSGRALRKTKSNPDPLANARQGTDFAISRLERVYTARRRAEAELTSLQSRLKAQDAADGAAGSVARIWLSSGGGKVRLAWLDNSLTWKPAYDFRLDGSGALRIALSAQLPPVDRGAELSISLRSCQEAHATTPYPVKTGDLPPLIASWNLPVAKLSLTPAPLPSLSFSLNLPQGVDLPPGPASVFYNGEYLGNADFVGGKPGEAVEVFVAR